MSGDKRRESTPNLLAKRLPGFSVAWRTLRAYQTQGESTIVLPPVVTNRSSANQCFGNLNAHILCMTNCFAGRRTSFLSVKRARTLIYGGLVHQSLHPGTTPVRTFYTLA